MNRAPTFEDIFAVMSAAAVGNAGVRVPIPERPDPDHTPTRFAIAVNLLLDDLHFRSREALAATEAARADLERQVAERTLQLGQSEAKFSTAFKASPAAISIATLPDGRWIEVNGAHEAMTGYSREESLGRTSGELGLVDPEERAKILASFREKGSIRGVEIRLHTKSGAFTDVLISAENIVLDGRPCALTIQYDITELKNAEREVRRLNADLEKKQAALKFANRELESFSYSVAHDLRTPLRSIDGFSKMLLDGYADRLDAQGIEYFNRIRGSAQRMAQLIDDILALSRVAGSELRIAPVSLTQLVRAAAERMRSAEPGREVEISVAEDITVNGDAGLLGIVVENLIGNAWKFTGKTAEARITFGARRQDGERIYFVEDNGAGFDMAYAAKLFGVFQRLHSIQDFSGTGIGLATVQRVISRHGGRVWGEGKVGAGAAFSFTLNAEAAPG